MMGWATEPFESPNKQKKEKHKQQVFVFLFFGGSEGRIFEHTFLFKATCSDRLIIELVVSFVIRSEIGFSVKL